VLANNAFAIAFSIQAIENYLFDRFTHVAFLFAGLLLYDVTFVFGSDVMTTVAQGIEGPIKILIASGNG